MPNITCTIADTAGGVIEPGMQDFVRFNGFLIALVGDSIAGHGPSPHDGPKMIQGSGFVRINGIPVCFQGCLASCGHTSTGQAGMAVSE